MYKLHVPGMSTKRDPCKKQACAIQKCLQENNFQQDRCGRAINEMIRCCAKLSQPSICCSGFRRELPSPSADTPPPTAPDSSFEQAHDKETLNKPTTRRAEGHKTYTL
uniref:cx9C motif-containing protein 4 isoform X4 n=1 Tax=Myxine glutinosa TaxID=7769 RepID=UPI00358F84B7